MENSKRQIALALIAHDGKKDERELYGRFKRRRILMAKSQLDFDVVIIGGGPAGAPADKYLNKRAKLVKDYK